MPRTKPLPPREFEVCHRLKLFRADLGLSQHKFAMILLIDGKRLASYEYGRAPLPYAVFRRAAVLLHLSPTWLATGEGLMRSVFPFNDSFSSAQENKGDSFLSVYDAASQSIGSWDRFLKESEVASLSELAKELAHFCDNSPSVLMVNPHLIMRTHAAMDLIIQVVYGTSGALPEDAPPELLKSQADLKAAVLSPDFGMEYEKTFFDSVTQGGNSHSVEYSLPNLLKRIETVCTAYGKKSELAKFLGVPMPRVSEWLADVRSPGGETTLRMLEWVTAEEAKQTKSPGSVDAPPEPKTRPKQSSNEKPKTGPP